MDDYIQNLLAAANALNDQLEEIETYPIEQKSQELAVEKEKNALRAAQDALEDHFIRAPMAGVLTKRDAKVGEHIAANSIIVSIISSASWEIKANVPEADVAKITAGNTASITLDAYDAETIFEATVLSVNPAETMVEGVATYEVTLQFAKDDERIKSGMTANINIASDKKEDVIAIPQRALFKKEGGMFVKILEKETVREVAVSPGLRGSDGNIEITSGVNEGDKVITSLK